MALSNTRLLQTIMVRITKCLKQIKSNTESVEEIKTKERTKGEGFYLSQIANGKQGNANS